MDYSPVGDHTACQAAHNALYECAVEIMENPPGVGTQRFWLDSRLGTMGHMLHREGWTDILHERDEAVTALRVAAERIIEIYQAGFDSERRRLAEAAVTEIDSVLHRYGAAPREERRDA